MSCDRKCTWWICVENWKSPNTRISVIRHTCESNRAIVTYFTCDLSDNTECINVDETFCRDHSWYYHLSITYFLSSLDMHNLVHLSGEEIIGLIHISTYHSLLNVWHYNSSKLTASRASESNHILLQITSREHSRRRKMARPTQRRPCRSGSPAHFVLYQVLWVDPTSARASVQVHSRRDATLDNLRSLQTQEGVWFVYIHTAVLIPKSLEYHLIPISYNWCK